MSEKIIQLNEGIIKDELKELVRSSVEETLNGLLEKEAEELVNASKSNVQQSAKAIAQGIMIGI